MVRHHAFRRIAVGSLRRSRSVSNQSSSQEQNQTLHRGLEQLQNKPPEVVAATTSPREYQISKQRTDRLNQAAINAACSFLVVLLAAQSYKSGVERRKAMDHLEAATEVLKEKQKKLKELVDPATADDLAASCMEALQAQQRLSKPSAWWSESKLDESVVEQQISTMIHGKLRSLIDPTDFEDDDRDKELVRKLVKTVDPPSKKQVFTI